MRIFLDNFHQGGKYSAQISSHQAELRREKHFTDQKYLSISSIQTEYPNIGSGSGFGKNSERENIFQTKCNFCGGVNHSAEKCFKRIRKGKEKARADGDSLKKRTERMPHKCFRCVSEYHLIVKFRKRPKENQKPRKQVFFNERVNRASQK